MRNVLFISAFAALAMAAQAAVDRRTPVVEAVEKAIPSVVNIGTEQMVRTLYTDPLQRFRGDLFDEFFRNFFDTPTPPGYRMKHSLGSGVIVDPGGYILTNFHVIERASRIRVMMSDETIYDAVFLAGDQISDLALIKIDTSAPLPAVVLAKDDDLMLGETVITLGNPFGLAHTVTVGVLSAKNREARFGGEVLYRDILQTDAAVNPGNSGGPLLNINGELIGINVAIYQQAQNIGFAVPIKRARTLLGHWFSMRYLKKAWLGFEPEETNGVLQVGAVDPGGDAARAGLRKGMVIRAINDEAVDNLYDYNKKMLRVRMVDDVRLTVADGAATNTVGLALVPLPKPSGEKLARTHLGIEFGARPGDDSLLSYYRTGLPVLRVDQGGAAAKAGLQTGPLVTSINDMEINTMDDVGLALQNVRPGDPITLGLATIVKQNAFIIAQTSALQLTAE